MILFLVALLAVFYIASNIARIFITCNLLPVHLVSIFYFDYLSTVYSSTVITSVFNAGNFIVNIFIASNFIAS